MIRTLFLALVGLFVAATLPVFAASAPDIWDGLVKVKSKKVNLVYLLPDADFRSYTKVMLDPTSVAFRKNWKRDHSESMELSNNVSDRDVRRILDDAQKGFQKLFADAYARAGYQVVDAPDADVLRLSTAIINLDVAAPDVMSAGRSRSYSRDAGQATLVIEARDSLSGTLLGRAVDNRIAGDGGGPYIRNSVTNASEFEQVFTRWAQIGANGLAELKTLSPINTSGLQQKR